MKPAQDYGAKFKSGAAITPTLRNRNLEIETK